MAQKSWLLASTVLISAGFATGAFAQTPPAAAPAAAQDEEAQPAAEAEDVVVVTGSRVRRNEFTSAAPIQVLTPEVTQLGGGQSTSDMLYGSSLAAGSAQVTNVISTSFVTNGGPGAETISLRGLGANRTLVLLNGRRAGPAGVRGGVSSFDLNVLPLSIVSRTEILKDGASSIYGSDAIAGVVNIITRDKLDTLQVGFSATQPFESGGEQLRANAAWGNVFERGSVQVAVDYFKQEYLRNRDRDFLACPQDYMFSPTNGLRTDLIDPRTDAAKCRALLTGQIWLYDYDPAPGPRRNNVGNRFSGMQLEFDGSGRIGQVVPEAILPAAADSGDIRAPANWFRVNVAGLPRTSAVANQLPEAYLNESLIPEVERTTAYLAGTFDLTSSVELYAEVLANRRVSNQDSYRQMWTYNYTEDFFTYFGGTGGERDSVGFRGPWVLSPTLPVDNNDASQTVDYMRGVLGARGSFPVGFLAGPMSWDIYGQYSKSDGEYSQDVIVADARNTQNFRLGTCVGTRTPISNRACIDIPFTSARVVNGQFTDAERAFLFDVDVGNTVYEQLAFEAVVSADLINLPAGPLGAALGIAYREDSIDDTPGIYSSNSNAWGTSSAQRTVGEDTTSEIFAEVEVPVVNNLPLVESLTVNLSGRYTDVDSYGDGSTYKLGLNWQVSPEFRFRATQGTSFRTPALFELFLASQTSFLGQRQIDPCIGWGNQPGIIQRLAQNCAAQGVSPNHTGAGSSATIVSSGGFGRLRAETSEATALGFVWTPSFADLQVAVDYIDILVEDQVTRLGAGNIIFGCLLSDTFPTDQLCSLYTRQAGTRNIETVNDNYINVATQTNRGVDLTVEYRRDLGWGDLRWAGQFTWQFEDKVGLFADRVTDDNGTVGEPKFVGNTNLQLRRGDWTYFWGMDIVGPASEGDFVGNIVNSALYGGQTLLKINTETTIYHDLSARWRNDGWSITGGVANVFGELPPALSNELNAGRYGKFGTVTDASQYDLLGRRAFINVSYEF